MSSTIIPMSIDDGVASIHGCDIACMSVPWIFSIGFATTFSALFAKIWRIHTVMSRAMRFTRVVIRERDAMKWIILVFTLNVILLLSWTLIDPLQWKRQYINGDVTNSYGTCQADGNASDVFVGLLILVDGAALFAALLLAYRARNLEDEFTESKWIGVACASWIQVILIGIPVVLLTRTQPTAQVSQPFIRMHLQQFMSFSTSQPYWLVFRTVFHFHHSDFPHLFLDALASLYPKDENGCQATRNALIITLIDIQPITVISLQFTITISV